MLPETFGVHADATFLALRKWVEHAGAPNEHAQYSLSDTLARPQTAGLALRPRLRHAYHMASGEEGHARVLGGNRAVFHPGGHAHSFVCPADDLCFGPHVQQRQARRTEERE